MRQHLGPLRLTQLFVGALIAGCGQPSIPESALNRSKPDATTGQQSSAASDGEKTENGSAAITGNPTIQLADILENKEQIVLTYRVDLQVEGGQLDPAKPVDVEVKGAKVTSYSWNAPNELKISLMRTAEGSLKITRLNFAQNSANTNMPRIEGVATWTAFKKQEEDTPSSATNASKGSKSSRRSKSKKSNFPNKVPPMNKKAEEDFWKKHKM